MGFMVARAFGWTTVRWLFAVVYLCWQCLHVFGGVPSSWQSLNALRLLIPLIVFISQPPILIPVLFSLVSSIPLPTNLSYASLCVLHVGGSREQVYGVISQQEWEAETMR